MEAFKTPEEIEELKRECKKHFDLAINSSDEKEKFCHFHKAFPFITSAPGKTDPLHVYYDHRFNSLWVGDRHGFITLMTIDQLYRWLKKENENPGCLREFVTGENLYRKQYEHNPPTEKESEDAFETLKGMFE